MIFVLGVPLKKKNKEIKSKKPKTHEGEVNQGICILHSYALSVLILQPAALLLPKKVFITCVALYPFALHVDAFCRNPCGIGHT